ncbi:MAG: hypothetical protein EOP09_19715, partial [Proteobacteria bacterium]
MKVLSALIGIATAIFAAQALDNVTTMNRAPAAGKVRISAVQYPIAPNTTFQKFKSKVEGYVTSAAQDRPSLVIFPELLTMDLWDLKSGKSDHDMAIEIAQNSTEPYFNCVAELSQKYQLPILAGSSPRLKQNRVYNTSMLVFPNGRRVYHDKIFLTQWEKEQGWSTGDGITVFDAPWGKTAMLTCFDSEFPKTTQLLADVRPEFILIPSMT